MTSIIVPQTRSSALNDDLFGSLDRLFGGWLVPVRQTVAPVADVYKEGSDIVICLDTPGISKEDLKVSLADSVLTVEGERKQQTKVEEKDFYRLEREVGKFSRSFRLPEDVDDKAIKASCKDGVLEVRIPAKAQKEPSTRVVAVE